MLLLLKCLPWYLRSFSLHFGGWGLGNVINIWPVEIVNGIKGCRNDLLLDLTVEVMVLYFISQVLDNGTLPDFLEDLRNITTVFADQVVESPANIRTIISILTGVANASRTSTRINETLMEVWSSDNSYVYWFIIMLCWLLNKLVIFLFFWRMFCRQWMLWLALKPGNPGTP